MSACFCRKTISVEKKCLKSAIIFEKKFFETPLTFRDQIQRNAGKSGIATINQEILD
jgi:hypothetical protein